MPFPCMPHQQKRPEFPSTDDLCNLSLDEARQALAALRVLVDLELADVYTSAGSNDTRWNVWLNVTRRRVPLPEWAAEWVETWYSGRSPDDTPPDDGPDGGDAA